MLSFLSYIDERAAPRTAARDTVRGGSAGYVVMRMGTQQQQFYPIQYVFMLSC